MNASTATQMKTAQALAKAANDALYRKMAHTFGRVDTTLTNRLVRGGVKIELTDDTSAPIAASSGAKIIFNTSKIGNPTDLDQLVAINGLNYHELAHVLYTPNFHGENWVNKLGYKYGHATVIQAINILEDARIESLLVARYTSVAPYFAKAFFQYILDLSSNKPNTKLDEVFVLSHGRKFLPKDIRVSLRDAYKDQGNVFELGKIIDQFRLLDLPLQMRKAGNLVQRFLELTRGSLEDLPTSHGAGREELPNAKGVHSPDTNEREKLKKENQSSNNDKMQDKNPNSKANKEKAEKEKEKEKETAEDTEDAETSEEDSDDTTSEGNGSATGEGDTDTDDDSDETGDVAGQSGGQESDSDGDDDTAGDAQAQESGKTSGAGSTGGRDDAMTQDELDDLLGAIEDAADSIMSDPEVVDQLKEIQNGITSTRATGSTVTPDTAAHVKYSFEVDESYRLAARRMSSIFNRVAGENDPAFVHHTPSGRLNIQRVMTGDVDIETAFDRWDEGVVDANDMETVIGVDVSSSMMSMEASAFSAVWAVKRSIESLNTASVIPVFTFSTESEVVIRNERATSNNMTGRASGGGTNPNAFLRDSLEIFRSSTTRNKLLVIVTDGAWQENGFFGSHYGGTNEISNDELVKQIQKLGVEVAVFFLEDRRWITSSQDNQTAEEKYEEFGHGAQHFAAVHSAFDMLPLTESIVKGMVRR